MTRARLRPLPAIVAVAVVAAACSSTSEPEPAPVSTTTTTEVATRASPPPGPWVSAGEPGVGGRMTDVTFDPSDCEVMLAAGDLLGAVRSEDGGATWTQIAGLTGREVSRFTWDPTDPERLWIATMSGPFLSTDGGRSVSAAREGMPAPTEFTYTAPIETVLFDPAQPGRLLAFGGSHRRWDANPGSGFGTVWESTDNGSTWNELSSLGENRVLAASRTATGWVASVDEVGTFVSPDGRSWEGPLDDLVDSTVAQFLESGGRLWAAITSFTSDGGVASSTDGGRTWTLDEAGLPQSGVTRSDFATSFESLAADRDATVLYAGDVGFGSATVSARPADAPQWSVRSSTTDLPRTAFDTGLIPRAMAVSPCDPDTVLIGTDETLWLSRDGAVTWTDLSAQEAGEESWIGTGFGGMVATGADVLEDGTLLTTSMDGGNLLVRRTDGTWVRPLRAEHPFGGGYDVDARAGAAVVALGQNGVVESVAVTTDSGRSWRESDLTTIDGFPTEGELPVAVAVAPDGAWLLVAGGSLWRAADTDLRWNRVDVGAQVHDVATTPELVVLATDFGVMLSDAGLRSTIPIAGPSAPAGDAELTVTDDGTVAVAIWREGEYGVWLRRSGDAASSWARISENPRAKSVAIDPDDPAHLVVALEDRPFHDATYSAGIIETFDSGRTWEERAEGLPLERVSVVIADPTRPGHWLAGTHGSGWWESVTGGSAPGQDGGDNGDAGPGGSTGE